MIRFKSLDLGDLDPITSATPHKNQLPIINKKKNKWTSWPANEFSALSHVHSLFIIATHTCDGLARCLRGDYLIYFWFQSLIIKIFLRRKNIFFLLLISSTHHHHHEPRSTCISVSFSLCSLPKPTTSTYIIACMKRLCFAETLFFIDQKSSTRLRPSTLALNSEYFLN